MTHTALIAFAPVTTLERINEPGWTSRVPDRLMYDSGSLKFFPHRSSVPLIVDHEDRREIGSRLSRLECEDGPWFVAAATITDPPSWLRRGTPASFAFKCPRLSSFNEAVMRSAYVTEVSVLSPGVAPAEPLARVLTFDPAKPPAARPKSPSRPAAVHQPAPRPRRARTLDEELLQWMREAPEGLDEKTYSKLLVVLVESRRGPTIYDFHREHFAATG